MVDVKALFFTVCRLRELYGEFGIEGGDLGIGALFEGEGLSDPVAAVFKLAVDPLTSRPVFRRIDRVFLLSMRRC